MADPITLGTVAAVGTAGGGIVQGLGAKMSGDAQASAYRYKAGVALLNKQINEQNASWALESGGIKGEEAGLKAGQEKGESLAVMGASGMDVNSGSNAVVRDTQTKVAQFDQNVIAWNAAKTSWGFESKAATDQAEANLDIVAADDASRAGTISMIGSFLGAAGSVAGKWYQGTSVGMFGRSGSGDSASVKN
jgi:hypothetical protein